MIQGRQKPYKPEDVRAWRTPVSREAIHPERYNREDRTKLEEIADKVFLQYHEESDQAKHDNDLKRTEKARQTPRGKKPDTEVERVEKHMRSHPGIPWSELDRKNTRTKLKESGFLPTLAADFNGDHYRKLIAKAKSNLPK